MKMKLKSIKLFTFLILLMFVFVCIGCKSDEVVELNKQIDDLIIENQKIKEENANLQKNIDALNELIDEMTSENENKDSEINSLQDEKNNLKNEIKRLLESEVLEEEWINVIYKIFNTGMSVNEYMEFKKNNVMINENEYIRELFDKIYYYYNKTDSITFFEELAEYSGLTFINDLVNTSDNQIEINILDQNNILRIFRMQFFNSELEKYLYIYNISGTESPSFKQGKNFFIIDNYGSEFFDKLNDLGLNKISDYISFIIESYKFIDKKECFNNLNKIAEEENYSLEIKSTDDIKFDSAYYILNERDFVFSIYPLTDEYDLSVISTLTTELQFIEVDEKYRETIYRGIYIFGKYAFIHFGEQKDENVLNSDLYKYVVNNGINAWDYYLNNIKK